MNNKKVDPFGFPVAEEYKLYKKNCKEPKQAPTYLEWKEHILSYLKQYSDRNLENFEHYMINKKRKSERKLDRMNNVPLQIISLVTTIFVAYISILITLGTNFAESIYSDFETRQINLIEIFQELGGITIGITIVGIIIIFVIFQWIGKKRKKLLIKIDFYEDLLSIIDQKKC